MPEHDARPAEVYPVAGELAERMESTYIELKDISQEVSGKEDEIEFNPERLDEVNERLNLIYTLQQKHRVSTVDELLALTDEYAAKLSAITSSDEHIEELKARCDALYNKVKKQAAVLTKRVLPLPVKWRSRWLRGWFRWACPMSVSR